MASRWIQRSKKKKHPSDAYRSRFEAQVALALSRAGATFEYETLRLNYTKEATYTPDFILPNGVIVECKGYWLPSDRTKHLRVRKDNPDRDIRFCFQNPYNTLSKKSRTTYMEWCEKHDFLWCDKIIPIEWTH